MRYLLSATTTLLLAAVSLKAGAQPSPEPVADIGVDEKLGAKIPEDITFLDERERRVTIGDLASGERPVVLVLAYYRCPMLCGLVLEGVADTVIGSGKEPGEDFDLVTVSFDPEDHPAQAHKRKRPVLAKFEEEVPWTFLSGDPSNVARLLDAVGVRVRKDPKSGQYAHPAVFLVLTPKGEISRYLYGFEIRPFDLEMALAEASRGNSGPSFSKLLLRCFAYDPATRKYGLIIDNAFRVGGVVLLLLVGGVVGGFFGWERRRRRRGCP